MCITARLYSSFPVQGHKDLSVYKEEKQTGGGSVVRELETHKKVFKKVISWFSRRQKGRRELEYKNPFTI